MLSVTKINERKASLELAETLKDLWLNRYYDAVYNDGEIVGYEKTAWISYSELFEIEEKLLQKIIDDLVK